MDLSPSGSLFIGIDITGLFPLGVTPAHSSTLIEASGSLLWGNPCIPVSLGIYASPSQISTHIWGSIRKLLTTLINQYETQNSLRRLSVVRARGGEGLSSCRVAYADLLPAPLWAAHRFPPSIRVYICHLRGSEGGQDSPRNYFDTQHLQSPLPSV